MRKMIRRSILILPGCLFFLNLSAQDCNCQKEFTFVKNYIEKNYAGFKDKIQLYSETAYNKHTASIAATASKAKKESYCVYLISKWFEFFKEGHIQIGYNGNVDINDSTLIRQLFAATEKINLSPKQLNTARRKKNIEGIYWYRDSAYKLAIIRSPTPFRDYAAVILESKSNLWKPGMVKFELKQTAVNKFDCIFYYRDHHAQLAAYNYDNGVFNNGDCVKEGIAAKQTTGSTQDRSVLESKNLSGKTFYIRISSFDQKFAKAIDSLFKADTAALNHLPNLVLDLRGNGGGADFAFSPLIPYLYTNPINTVGLDVLSTKDNIEGWRALLSSPDLPDDTKAWVQKLVDAMQNHLGSFINAADDETLILTGKKQYPQKIAILVDKDCASTTEQFLLSALQSKKVILMGQHTEGVLDYANIRDIKLLTMPYTLSYATTRSRRIPAEAIDNKGILPHILLPDDKDWIQAAMQQLEQ